MNKSLILIFPFTQQDGACRILHFFLNRKLPVVLMCGGVCRIRQQLSCQSHSVVLYKQTPFIF